jgi:hypothetical protein
MALRRCELIVRAERDPELEQPQRIARQRATVVPHPVACFHPFETSGADRAFLAGGVFIGHRTSKDDCEGGDAGVRVNPEERLAGVAHLGAIQEYERLDRFARARRAYESRDRAVPAAESPMRDATWRFRCWKLPRFFQDGFHEFLLS